MFDPYHKWLGIPKKHRPPTYYQLLGISPEETDSEVIEEATVRQTSHVRAYQIGPQAKECTRILNEIALARTTLLNPAKRKEYDGQLRQRESSVATTAPSRPVPPPVPVDPINAFIDEELLPAPSAPLLERPRDLKHDVTIRKSPAVLYGVIAGAIAVPVVVLAIVLAVVMRSPTEDPVRKPVKQAQGAKKGVALEIPKNKAEPDPDPEPKPNPPPPEFRPAPLPGKVIVASDFKLVIKKEKRRFDCGPGQLVACLPDDQRFLTIGGGGMRTVHRQSGQMVSVKGPGGIMSFAVSWDGTRLLTGGVDKTARFWDLQTGKELSSFTKHTDRVYGVALSGDGSRALSWHSHFPKGPGKVYLWDTATGQELGSRDDAPGGMVTSAAFVPGETQIMLNRGSFGEKGRLCLWDPKTGEEKPVVTPPGNNSNIFPWTVSLKGDRILLRYDQTLQLVNARTGAALWDGRIQTFAGGVLNISLDGRLALSCGGASRGGKPFDCYIHVLDLETGRELCRFEADDVFSGAVFTRDGKHIAARTHKNMILYELPQMD